MASLHSFPFEDFFDVLPKCFTDLKHGEFLRVEIDEVVICLGSVQGNELEIIYQ
jgi:hypothetical protein